jgi:hypothetical protein
MRPLAFSPDSLRKLLLHDKIATLPDLKRALGTDVDLTVFRKLKELDYLTSYSHGGRFYTLREIARFGADGLWSCAPAWFSRYGTLLTTAEAFIRSSVAGYFAEELSAILHVGAQDVLRHLVQQKRIARELISGLFLYTSIDPAIRQRQSLTRRSSQSVPTVVDAARLEVSPDEMKAAIILFYSLLDEQQRRLYAGLESMKLGHGGDSMLAEFLASIRTPSPAGADSCWIRMSRSVGSDNPAPGANRWKKNARSNRSHRNPTGTRHRRRSHYRHSMDPQDACRNRRTAAPTRYRDLCQYRGAPASRYGFFPARESQGNCHRL